MKINFFICKKLASRGKIRKKKDTENKRETGGKGYCCSLRAFRKHWRQSGS